MRPSPLTFDRIDLWAIALATDKHFVGSLEKVTVHRRLLGPAMPEPNRMIDQSPGPTVPTGAEGHQ